MIIDQQRVILMIKMSHATKARSYATPNREDPQENEQKFNLHS